MKWKVYSIILILVIPIQTTFLHYFSIQGIRPDLGLIIVFLIGIHMGERDGLLMGGLIGLLGDLFSGGAFGTNLLTKSLVGWLSGKIGRFVLEMRVVLSMAILFGFSILTGLAIFLYLLVYGESRDFLAAFQQIIIPQAILDGLMGGILIFLFLMNRKAIRQT